MNFDWNRLLGKFFLFDSLFYLYLSSPRHQALLKNVSDFLKV